MKILVIGGSYFFGRWFLQLAHKNHEITVINRGNIKIGLPNVTEYVCDRHDLESLRKVAAKCSEFDAIVDFCGYLSGDIETIVDNFSSAGCRYIFISTVDVYERGSGKLLDENSRYETRMLPGESGAYISGKVVLEEELLKACSKKKMLPVSIRPSVLYGPANYAPREQIYLETISKEGKVYIPDGATGTFQMIYVLDAAKGLLKIVEMNPVELQNAYNFTTDEMISYDSLIGALHEALPIEFEEIRIPLEEICNQPMLCPFPLRQEESEKYSASLFNGLNIEHTNLTEGLRKIYDISQ